MTNLFSHSNQINFFLLKSLSLIFSPVTIIIYYCLKDIINHEMVNQKCYSVKHFILNSYEAAMFDLNSIYQNCINSFHSGWDCEINQNTSVGLLSSIASPDI